MSIFKSHKVDRLGVITAGLCAIHCGGWSIYNAIKSHRIVWPQVLIIAGVSTIVLGLLILDNHVIMAIGGFILLAGHSANWRLLGLSKS